MGGIGLGSSGFGRIEIVVSGAKGSGIDDIRNCTVDLEVAASDYLVSGIGDVGIRLQSQ